MNGLFRSCLAWALLATACGGDGGASDGSGGAAGGGGAATLDVLGACRDFAARFCELAAPCCESAYGGYDREACEHDFFEETCNPGDQAVAAGIATFHPEATEPCLEAQAKSLGECQVDFRRGAELRKQIWSQCKIIRGSTVAGLNCSATVTCAQPDGEATAVCASPGGVCTELRFLGEGQTCPFPNGTVPLCDVGTYCTAEAAEETGVCAPVTPEGAGCEPLVNNRECGLGSYCDLADAVCRPVEPGASCAQGTECASFICDDTTQTCEPQEAVIARSRCR